MSSPSQAEQGAPGEGSASHRVSGTDWFITAQPVPSFLALETFRGQDSVSDPTPPPRLCWLCGREIFPFPRNGWCARGGGVCGLCSAELRQGRETLSAEGEETDAALLEGYRRKAQRIHESETDWIARAYEGDG